MTWLFPENIREAAIACVLAVVVTGAMVWGFFVLADVQYNSEDIKQFLQEKELQCKTCVNQNASDEFHCNNSYKMYNSPQCVDIVTTICKKQCTVYLQNDVLL